MRVETMETLPARAGGAKLQFLSSQEMPHNQLAVRQNDTILLNREDARFYPLKDGEQFLFTNSASLHGRRLYFGGMDESPFLVELHLSVFESLLDGEDAFYEALKPNWIRRAEKEFRKPAKRQGDFFAFAPAKDLSTFLHKHLNPGHKTELQVVEKVAVDDTRHLFTGLHFRLTDNRGALLARGGEGVLEAPDHEELRLSGPHVIMQALHLVRPKEAD